MKKSAILLAVILVFWGCRTYSRDYELGSTHAVNKNWDKAVVYYEKALVKDPTNAVYRLALVRARIAASLSHLSLARNLAASGKIERSLEEYEIALSYDPFNRNIASEIRRLKGEEEEQVIVEPVKIEPPIKLRVGDETMDLKFPREISLKSIFQALSKHARINIIFDEQFRDKQFSIDLTNMTFEQALNTLCVASKNFSRIIDESTVIIVPDQPMNRSKYEINAIKTFYLSNINAQEIQGALTQMLRTTMKAPQVIIHKELNAVTIKDVPEMLELAERLIRLWDKPKGEVVVDLEIMEVSRIRLKELGINFDKIGTGIRYTGVNEGGWANLNDIDLGKSGNYQISIPTAFLDVLATDSHSKIIAQPRLRSVEGQKMEFVVADEIPIPRTTFTPFAGGGIAQQPITSFDYKPVGIEVGITATIHLEGEITLEMDIKIKSLGGTGFADLPIISTRNVKNIIRLKDGETNLLAGLLKDEERSSLSGIAGLKNIPVLGRLFSNNSQTVQQTDVILTITPYIIRAMPITDQDNEPLWVNLNATTSASGGGGASGLPEESYRDARERLRQARAQQAIQQGENRLTLAPGNFEVPQGRETRIQLNIRTSQEIANMSLNVVFTSGILELKDVVMGGFVRQLRDDPSFLKNIDNASGACTIGFTSPDLNKGYRGSGGVAVLVFTPIEKGEATVTISGISANSPTGESIPFVGGEARIRVR